MPAKPQWTETTTTTAIICLLLSCNVYKTFLFNRKSITYFKISTYGTLSISVKYIRIILSSYQPCTSTCLLKAILYLIFHLFSFLKLILSQFCIDHVIWRTVFWKSERERECKIAICEDHYHTHFLQTLHFFTLTFFSSF